MPYFNTMKLSFFNFVDEHIEQYLIFHVVKWFDMLPVEFKGRYWPKFMILLVLVIVLPGE